MTEGSKLPSPENSSPSADAITPGAAAQHEQPHFFTTAEQPDADRATAEEKRQEQHHELLTHPLPPAVEVPRDEQPDLAALSTSLLSEVAPPVSEWLAPPPSQKRLVPSIVHTLAFGGLVLLGLILMELFFGVVVGLHLFGISSIDKLQKEPLLLIPSMAGAYFIATLLCFPIFSVWWDRPFLDGIRLNWATARRYIARLFFTGVGVGLVIQFISNYLPIPRELPIDEFFKTTSGVWVIAVFGVIVAPAFEELAFRGFLLPSMATTWHWLGHKIQGDPMPEVDPITGKPRWSNAATMFAIVTTSIPFMLIHADQLAHAWAPLAVLFAVSVVLCEVRLRTGSLAASILVHSSYNFSIFATLFFATGGFRHLENLKG